MERKEYLQRPLIEGVVFDINENFIRIQNDSTLFVGISRHKSITLSAVEKNLRELKTIAKESGKLQLIGAAKYLATVRKLYPEYKSSVEQLELLYSEITELSVQLQADGIHLGCRDDELLDTISDKCNEYSKYFYRSSALSQFMEYYHKVEQTLREKLWREDDVVGYKIRLA